MIFTPFFQLVLGDVTLDDIGEYTCMSAKIDGIDVQQSVKLFNVDVAMPARARECRKC